MDWKTLEFDLTGTEQGVDFAALDPMLIPCASRITLFDGSVIGGDDECVWEQSKINEFMDGAFNFIAYYNQKEFVDAEFDEDNIIKQKSVLHSIFSTTNTPVVTLAFIKLHELIDET